MRSPKKKTVWFNASNRPHKLLMSSVPKKKLLMSPVPGREKKKCSSTFDSTAPRLPASSSKHRRNKQEPTTCATTDTKRWSRTIRAVAPVRGARLLVQGAVATATPSQHHRIRSHSTERPCNYATAWRPRVPGPLVSGSLSRCSLALPPSSLTRHAAVKQKGVSEE
jgi:hypothetical protein